MLVSAPPRIPGLAAVVDRYDAFCCDVWGVVHNGLELFPGVAEALLRARERGVRVLLLTNAPRPAAPIDAQLVAYGLPRDAWDRVLTSGEATTEMLAEIPGRRIAHIGPDRDLGLYDGTEARLVADAEAELVVTTGLFDDDTETPDDYRERFTDLIGRGLTLVCANPDVVVQRGARQVWCAGALARLWDELGGEVLRIGKPHAPIYDRVRRRLSDLLGRPLDEARVLAIGDGLPTDIRGANAQGWDVLFVTGGIHAADLGPLDDPDPRRVEIRLMEEGLGASAFLPRLVW
jgi:HAD superfamily hydrolase (TIGR01459 family)